MNSWGSDEYIDLFNEIALNSDPSLPPDSCPFNNLHPNIELDILEQLEFQDYLNLALTCKKWYQTAISAPRSVKPDVHLDSLHMENGQRWPWNYSLSIRVKREKYEIDHHLISFQLVNKVKCEDLKISERPLFTQKGAPFLLRKELRNFILTNSSHFEFNRICIGMHDMDEETYLLTEPLFDMAPSISWDCDWMMEKFLLLFFENHLSHKHVNIRINKKTECINLVFKQWVEGKRLNLKCFSIICKNGRNNPFQWQNFTNGVEEFVKNSRIDDEDGDYSAKIVVPGLPDLNIRGCARHSSDREQDISFAAYS